MALEEFKHFFKESYSPEEDNTTGTSEFDESYNDDPDDCYCESSIFDDEDTDTEYDWLASKLDNEVSFWLGKCYNLWTSVPDVVYSSDSFGVDIIDYLPDDWEFAVTTPDIWKDLIDQTIRCSNAILYTIDEFDKLDPEQKMKHEGVKFDHNELIENINQIIQLANNVKSSSIFNILDSQHVMSAEEKAQVNDIYEVGNLFKAIAKDWVSKYKPNRLRYFQEAFDAITGNEIPIDHAYTMDEMKERTFSFKELFSKEKRAKRYIEKRITKLLPLFMTDINKLLSAHNNENLGRSLVMDMYYPRTVIVTHHDPATGMTYTTTEQQPTDEMVRLSFVISFFRKIIKKQHMMDMLDNPDVVYGLREELDAMFNCIHDIFKIKSTKEDLEKLFGIITSISNDINSFIDSFESNNEVSTMFDSIDYFSDVDVEPITIQEAKLPSKKRKKLPDSDFALVYTDGNGKKIRKYPIHDEAHCRAAAHMFPRGVPLKYKATVARKILRRAHKFGIDTSGWKNLNNFTKRSDK